MVAPNGGASAPANDGADQPIRQQARHFCQRLLPGETTMTGHGAADGQQVINIETEVDGLHTAPAVLVDRNQQWQRLDEMRSIAQKIFALLQGFVDQAQLAKLQVAQPAMNEAAGPARGAVAQVSLFEEAGAQPAERGVPGNAGAVDAAADNNQVKWGHA